ncbi:kinase-like domain-containing protein [Gigaspora rosea]|uniref:Kinase-like domain-containing protein n=1 Tax=Gigaspora rosea TaxID=44941 RepID=A0A397UX70_9GLOM|nr:kinase-like domain-containing protein [Gigaspora rosea]
MKSDRICGILPYIAPEILNKQQYTKASDIYSLAIIMWEILYGKPVPFELNSNKLQFQVQVCNGSRPLIYENTAKCYADLIRKCWNTEPKQRPTATEICNIFEEWKNSESILSELPNLIKNYKIKKMRICKFILARIIKVVLFYLIMFIKIVNYMNLKYPMNKSNPSNFGTIWQKIYFIIKLDLYTVEYNRESCILLI